MSHIRIIDTFYGQSIQFKFSKYILQISSERLSHFFHSASYRLLGWIDFRKLHFLNQNKLWPAMISIHFMTGSLWINDFNVFCKQICYHNTRSYNRAHLSCNLKKNCCKPLQFHYFVFEKYCLVVTEFGSTVFCIYCLFIL